MKKKLLKSLLVAAAMLMPMASFAQFSQYTFTTGEDSDTWMPLVNPINVSFNNLDDGYSADYFMFDFTFFGVTYNRFSANTNGMIHLGAKNSNGGYGAYSGFFTAERLDELGATICAFGSDLEVGAYNGDEYVKYEVQGSAPNRVLVIEYYCSAERGVDQNKVRYQIQLFETSNEVRMVYGAFELGEDQYEWYPESYIGIGASSFDALMVNGRTHVMSVGCSDFYNEGIWPGEGRFYNFSPSQCATITALSGSTSTTSSITIEWLNMADAYVVRYGRVVTDDEGLSEVSTLLNYTDTTLTINDLEPDEEYSFALYTICDGNYISFPYIFTVRTKSTESINDIEAKQVALYPNPSTGDVAVTYEIDGVWNLQVVDMQGRVVNSMNNISGSTVQLNSLATGVYFVRVQSEGHSVVKQLVVR